LFSSRTVPDLLDNPVVVEIATRIEKSPAQVLLRYLVELGVSVIPKSTNANRLRSNLDLFGFELSADDKAKLAGLDANIRICDFAFFQGIEKHPEFPFEQMKN
jgi:alcohol dehydrogenase (NADP+)